MKKELIIGTMTFVLAIALIYTPTGYAQNITTNASNMMNNASANINQTASELAKNDTLGNVLNKTGEVGKKILGGAADVVSNISEEVKEGIGQK
ncbi:MAG: hypothetical protein ACRD9Q_05210 [Nitrososphaeraceae archaeon]